MKRWVPFDGSTLVVGCGSIGRRHLRNLRTLSGGELLACDPISARAELARQESDARIVDNLEAGLACSPSSVVVCTPPHVHTDVALAAVETGADVLIEKPISHTLDGLDRLLEAASSLSRVVMVGYNLRFHPGLLKLKSLVEQGAVGQLLAIHAEFGQYLPDWRPQEDYRMSYFASARSGGGVVLDVSHEIDYVRWIGGEVRSILATIESIGGLQIETEDIAFISLRLDKGVLAQLLLDCLQRDYSRRCKIIGSEGILTWDFLGAVRHYSAVSGKWREFTFPLDLNATYLDEMRLFLSCVRREQIPHVDGVEGSRILRIALAAKESAKRRLEVEV